MPTSRTVSTVSTVRTQRYGGSTLRYGLYGTKYLLATMPTTVPTTMPTTRTVSTVSTVRTLRYGGSTLRYGLYGTKYLLATMPTTVPTAVLPCLLPCLPRYQQVRAVWLSSASCSNLHTSHCRRVHKALAWLPKAATAPGAASAPSAPRKDSKNRGISRFRRRDATAEPYPAPRRDSRP